MENDVRKAPILHHIDIHYNSFEGINSPMDGETEYSVLDE